MLCDWNMLSDDLQLTLSAEALRRARATLADQAEILAAAMDDGQLPDFGGAEALRLFASVARISDDGAVHAAGCA